MSAVHELAFTESALESMQKIPEEDRDAFDGVMDYLREHPYEPSQSFTIHREDGSTPKITVIFALNSMMGIVTIRRVLLTERESDV